MVIGQYTPGLWDHGGIAAYIRRVGCALRSAGHEVVYIDLASHADPHIRCPHTIICNSELDVSAKARSLGVQILHVHRDFPIDQTPPIPIIRTIHDHVPYCPSGGRYLKRPDRPCDRAYSLGGCLWGHVVDRCGSVRLGPLLSHFKTTWNEQRRLDHIPIIVSSEFVRQQMVREGYDPARLIFVPKAAPDLIATPAPLPVHPRFIFVGRIVPHKGLAWLLNSVASLPRPVRLDIAGDGVDLEAMKSLATKLKLNDRVTFHGWVDRATVERLLDQATALVVPSRWHEPFGLVSLEAMARGRAVIASNTGALSEVVLNGQTGLIVPVEMPNGLAVAMQQLADDPQASARMGLAGLQLVREQYTIKSHLDKLVGLYRQYAGTDVLPLAP